MHINGAYARLSVRCDRIEALLLALCDAAGVEVELPPLPAIAPPRPPSRGSVADYYPPDRIEPDEDGDPGDAA